MTLKQNTSFVTIPNRSLCAWELETCKRPNFIYQGVYFGKVFCSILSWVNQFGSKLDILEVPPFFYDWISKLLLYTVAGLRKKCSMSRQVVNEARIKNLSRAVTLYWMPEVLFNASQLIFLERAFDLLYDIQSRDVTSSFAGFPWLDGLCSRRETWRSLLGKIEGKDFCISIKVIAALGE